ncbi:MAG: type VI secretion system protein TssA [Pirellulales bacterium]
MTTLNVEELLRPFSDEAPCGTDLEYDPAFVEMGRASQRVPDQQYGSTIIPGKEPEWDVVKEHALDLLGRTKDLRVAVLLAQALLRTDGIAGLADALALIKGLIEQYWEPMFPRLDPDDDNDPTLRVNSIATLADNAALVYPLQILPIVRSAAAGSFSRRDIGVITGEYPRTKAETEEVIKQRSKLLDAAFQDVDLGVLRADALSASRAADLVRQLDKALTTQVGAGNSRSLEALAKELLAIHKILAERLVKRGGTLEDPKPEPPAEAAPEATAEVDGAAAELAASGAAGGVAAGGVAAVGPAMVAAASVAPVVQIVKVPDWDAEITSRDNAIKALDRVCQYFEKFEPSSPLPLLLRRAKRLSTKSFLEILKDISPGGLDQAQTLGGTDNQG